MGSGNEMAMLLFKEVAKRGKATVEVVGNKRSYEFTLAEKNPNNKTSSTLNGLPSSLCQGAWVGADGSQKTSIPLGSDAHPVYTMWRMKAPVGEPKTEINKETGKSETRTKHVYRFHNCINSESIQPRYPTLTEMRSNGVIIVSITPIMVFQPHAWTEKPFVLTELPAYGCFTSRPTNGSSVPLPSPVEWLDKKVSTDVATYMDSLTKNSFDGHKTLAKITDFTKEAAHILAHAAVSSDWSNVYLVLCARLVVEFLPFMYTDPPVSNPIKFQLNGVDMYSGNQDRRFPCDSENKIPILKLKLSDEKSHTFEGVVSAVKLHELVSQNPFLSFTKFSQLNRLLVSSEAIKINIPNNAISSSLAVSSNEKGYTIVAGSVIVESEAEKVKDMVVAFSRPVRPIGSHSRPSMCLIGGSYPSPRIYKPVAFAHHQATCIGSTVQDQISFLNCLYNARGDSPDMNGSSSPALYSMHTASVYNEHFTPFFLLLSMLHLGTKCRNSSCVSFYVAQFVRPNLHTLLKPEEWIAITDENPRVTTEIHQMGELSAVCQLLLHFMAFLKELFGAECFKHFMIQLQFPDAADLKSEMEAVIQNTKSIFRQMVICASCEHVYVPPFSDADMRALVIQCHMHMRPDDRVLWDDLKPAWEAIEHSAEEIQSAFERAKSFFKASLQATMALPAPPV